MTPTEQDKELRNILSQLMKDGITNTRADDPPQGRKMLLDEAVVAIKQLTTADRERLALEARIDELERLLHKGVCEVTVGWYHECEKQKNCPAIRKRITKLKAQQEEV